MDSDVHHRECNKTTPNNNKSTFCNCHRCKAAYWAP